MKKARMERTHDLVILRGLPGSGKSLRAREILSEYGDGAIFSADDYYKIFRRPFAEDLQSAHAWNRQRVQQAMEEGVHPIIIDNTNLRKWEMWPYVRMAYFDGYYVTFEELWGRSLEECYRACKAANSNIEFEDLERWTEAYEPVRNFFDVLHSTSAWRRWRNSQERHYNGW